MTQTRCQTMRLPASPVYRFLGEQGRLAQDMAVSDPAGKTDTIEELVGSG